MEEIAKVIARTGAMFGLEFAKLAHPLALTLRGQRQMTSGDFGLLIGGLLISALFARMLAGWIAGFSLKNLKLELGVAAESAITLIGLALLIGLICLGILSGDAGCKYTEC